MASHYSHDQQVALMSEEMQQYASKGKGEDDCLLYQNQNHIQFVTKLLCTYKEFDLV